MVAIVARVSDVSSLHKLHVKCLQAYSQISRDMRRLGMFSVCMICFPRSFARQTPLLAALCTLYMERQLRVSLWSVRSVHRLSTLETCSVVSIL